MDEQPVRSGLRERRLRAGLAQRELAEQAGISRQTLSALELGDSVPATNIALRLARVLGCRVEEIFWLDEEGGHLEATLLGSSGAGAPAALSARVAVAAVAERWVAVPLDGADSPGPGIPADGVVQESAAARPWPLVRVRTSRGAERLRQNLFVAGCDPALGLLAGHLGERFQGGRLHWLATGSGNALDMLARGEVHAAGVHLYDEESGEHNVAAVRRRLGGRAADQGTLLFNLATWEQGLVVAAGNPKRIKAVADLGRKGVRVVAREKGTGSQELLGRLAAEQGVPRKALQLTGVVGSHLAVARAVAAGLADAGVATRMAAVTCGLEFIALEEARFDLVLPRTADRDPRLERLVDVLKGARFKQDLGCLPGYGTARTGQLVAETPAVSP